MKIAKQRKANILNLLKNEREMSIQALVETFKVSPLTIRRDLEQLEKQGVQRYHGGARFVGSDEHSHQALRQLAIAKVAAKRLSNDDILFINSSSTALLALSQIRDTPLTAITNNGKALSTPIDPHIHLVLTGGDISFPKEALTGAFAISNLKNVTATRCLMGFSGMSLSMGLSTPNLTEVAVNHLMLERTAGEKIIVADSSKLNHNSSFSSGELTDITTLITDDNADIDFIETLKSMGIEVIIAKV